MKRTNKKLALQVRTTKALDADTLKKVAGGGKDSGFCLTS